MLVLSHKPTPMRINITPNPINALAIVTRNNGLSLFSRIEIH